MRCFLVAVRVQADLLQHLNESVAHRELMRCSDLACRGGTCQPRCCRALQALTWALRPLPATKTVPTRRSCNRTPHHTSQLTHVHRLCAPHIPHAPLTRHAHISRATHTTCRDSRRKTQRCAMMWWNICGENQKRHRDDVRLPHAQSAVK